MHPAAAAERDQSEVARVVAAVDGDELERVDHVVVGDPHDAARRLRLGDAEPLRRLRREPVDGVHVGVDLAAAEIGVVDPPESEVGVGCRCLRCRRVPYAAGPGTAPADRGPTWSFPKSSTQAMLPPPLPISTRSTTGTMIGYPPAVCLLRSIQ